KYRLSIFIYVCKEGKQPYMSNSIDMEVILSFVTSSFCTRTRNDVSDVFSSRNRSFTKEKVLLSSLSWRSNYSSGTGYNSSFRTSSETRLPGESGWRRTCPREGQAVTLSVVEKAQC